MPAMATGAATMVRERGRMIPLDKSEDRERNGRKDMNEEKATAGFAVLDNKGRLSLPKVVRSALHVEGGSTVAYVVAGDALLVVPQDAQLAALMERASRAVAAVGLTAQDYINEVPAVREELLRERYSAAFIAQLRADHAKARQPPASDDDDLGSAEER
jgi:bifunctional DNA-binding transcriptional regulator/antitoxin component of YhaV-PrlF toxin-antitoxin module